MADGGEKQSALNPDAALFNKTAMNAAPMLCQLVMPASRTLA
jgi:hypothetical protein